VSAIFRIDELGRTIDGAWGMVDDSRWLESPSAGGLDLLYLSPGDYDHAIRRLPSEEIANVVERRRATFVPNIVPRALGIAQHSVLDCIPATDDSEDGVRTRTDLIVALASYTGVPLFEYTRMLSLVDYLREGDGRIIAELESSSMRRIADLDASAHERTTRRRMVDELGPIAWNDATEVAQVVRSCWKVFEGWTP
jgi:hypothetical protein